MEGLCLPEDVYFKKLFFDCVVKNKVTNKILTWTSHSTAVIPLMKDINEKIEIQRKTVRWSRQFMVG